MSVAGANQCVRDLVEDRVIHVSIGILFDEVGGKLDPASGYATGIKANTRPANIVIVAEFPFPQSMLDQEPLRQLANSDSSFTRSERVSPATHDSPLPCRAGQ